MNVINKKIQANVDSEFKKQEQSLSDAKNELNKFTFSLAKCHEGFKTTRNIGL